MDWRRLDLNLLKVLACMLEERSVVRTADRLCITPSAVSHALGRLRRAFDDPLFVRVGSAMAPTARAAALERTVAAFMRSLDTQLDPARTTTHGFEPAASRRSVTLAAPGALELSLVPRIMEAMRREAPGMTLTVEAFQRRSYEFDLSGGRVDLVLSIGGHTPISDLIGAEDIWEDELVVLAGPASPLHGMSEPVDTDSFLAQPQIYPLSWPRSENYLDVALARSGKRRAIALMLPSYAGVGEVLTRTDMIVSLPDHAATVIARAYPALRVLRMTPARRTMLSLLWANAGVSEPAIAWMRQLITKVAREMRQEMGSGEPGSPGAAPLAHFSERK